MFSRFTKTVLVGNRLQVGMIQIGFIFDLAAKVQEYAKKVQTRRFPRLSGGEQTGKASRLLWALYARRGTVTQALFQPKRVGLFL